MNLPARFGELTPAHESLIGCGVQGQGVVCVKEGGIPEGTFVGEYVGELFTPWRW